MHEGVMLLICGLHDLRFVKMLHDFNSIIWQKWTPYMVVINLEIMQGKIHSNIFMWHADKISKWCSCCRLNGKFIWFVLQKLHDMTWIWHKTIWNLMFSSVTKSVGNFSKWRSDHLSLSCIIEPELWNLCSWQRNPKVCNWDHCKTSKFCTNSVCLILTYQESKIDNHENYICIFCSPLWAFLDLHTSFLPWSPQLGFALKSHISI
jgi:hypothetical protein